MKHPGRRVALAAVAGLLWLATLIPPALFSWNHRPNSRAASKSSGAMRFVEILADNRALADRLLEEDVVGYVSEDAIDVRVGGPQQARYYLSQYALAPTLLDLEADPSREASAHESTLACFHEPARLAAFLAAHAQRIVVAVAPGIALVRARND